MGKAPKKCPMCNEKEQWILVDTERKGYSMKKDIVGTVFLGPIGGWVAGMTGKKYKTYCCGKCGFTHDYAK